MNISLVAAKDGKTTDRIINQVIPLALETLDKVRFVDFAMCESVKSKLRGRGYYSSEDNVIMTISFDPKSCGVPNEYCNGDCNDCIYNPIIGMLDPYANEGPVVITCRNTIDLLLDVIILLVNANKNALLREKSTEK